MTKNTQIIFKQDPGRGWVSQEHMETKSVEIDVTKSLEKGQILLKNLYLSVDPYMRGRMNTSQKSYIGAFKLGEPLQGDDIVSTMINWENYTVLDANAQVTKISEIPGIPLSHYLGVLGMPGMTAYGGLLEIGKPNQGETVFISGAAGAVGLIVGQLAKIKGCRVIGSAGSDEKIQLLKEKFGYDDAFNYKSVSSINDKLAELAPKGIDVYFDNVGGETLDAAINNMNKHGRIVACGMISQYNAKPEEAYHIRNLMQVVGKELLIKGFIVTSFLNPSFIERFYADMTTWITSKKLFYSENVVEGIQNAPDAFIGMLKGQNIGKQVVKV